MNLTFLAGKKGFKESMFRIYFFFEAVAGGARPCAPGFSYILLVAAQITLAEFVYSATITLTPKFSAAVANVSDSATSVIMPSALSNAAKLYVPSTPIFRDSAIM